MRIINPEKLNYFSVDIIAAIYYGLASQGNETFTQFCEKTNTSTGKSLEEVAKDMPANSGEFLLHAFYAGEFKKQGDAFLDGLLAYTQPKKLDFEQFQFYSRGLAMRSALIEEELHCPWPEGLRLNQVRSPQVSNQVEYGKKVGEKLLGNRKYQKDFFKK